MNDNIVWLIASAWSASFVGLTLFLPITVLAAVVFIIVRPQRSLPAFLCFSLPVALVVSAFLVWASSASFFRLFPNGPIFWHGVPGALLGALVAIASSGLIMRAIRGRFLR